MAVTKIRRFSSWILILCTLITLAVLGLFFFGGDLELYKGELWNPKYVDVLLYWQYALFGLTVFAAIILGIYQFIASFRTNPKGGMMGLVVILLFAALLFLSYSFGDTTPLNILNTDAQVFNVPFWLKITDMWLYTTYTLTGLVILAIIGGSIKRIFNK